MISLATARKLKNAGLGWTPAMYDFFAIPDHGMDDRIFVISDMLVTVEKVQGVQMILFQGASEWALDTLVTTESVWLPSEEQLRLALEAAMIQSDWPEVNLITDLSGCTSTINLHQEKISFHASNASEAYAAGLIYLLEK